MKKGINMSQLKSAVLNEVVTIKTVYGEQSAEIINLDCIKDYSEDALVISYDANVEDLILSGDVSYAFVDYLVDDYRFDSAQVKDIFKLLLNDIKQQLDDKDHVLSAKSLFRQVAHEL